MRIVNHESLYETFTGVRLPSSGNVASQAASSTDAIALPSSVGFNEGSAAAHSPDASREFTTPRVCSVV